MNKEVLIKNVIEKVLEPEGFSYVGRFDGISSEFLRKVKNSKGEIVKQIITLQENRYCKEVFLNLESTAAGHDMGYRINDFVPNCTTDGLYFESEEEYKEVIEKFSNILQEYGIPFLEEIKESKLKNYLTDRDNERLFYEHRQLVENILKREKIKIENMMVEEVAEFIEKKILAVKEKPFEEVRNLLLELSALFGAVVNQYYSCQWSLNDDFCLSCSLEFSNLEKENNKMFVIKTLFLGWREEIKEEGNNISYEWDSQNRDFFDIFSDKKENNTIKIKEELLSEYKSCTQ